MYLHSLFKHLPTTEREYLVSRSELKTYRRNEKVCATDERIEKYVWLPQACFGWS